MTGEDKLRDELLRENGQAAAPLTAAADDVIRRERRRVRWWAAATAAAWIVTALYFLVLLWAYMVFIHPYLHEFLTNPEIRDEVRTEHAYVLIGGLKALLFWPVLLLLAAGCTTLFTLAARRATLRQIQHSLAEISAQLKGLTTAE
jgi:hypothetical protein